MFGNAKLCNHNIAKHTQAYPCLQYQKLKKFAVMFLKNSKYKVIGLMNQILLEYNLQQNFVSMKDAVIEMRFCTKIFCCHTGA